MKIISLNTWGGRAGRERQLEFFRAQKGVDVFCLQEVWASTFDFLEGKLAGGRPIANSEVMARGAQDIADVLEGHSTFFRPHLMDGYGLMMSIRSDFEVLEEGDIFVYGERGHMPEGDVGNHARNLQYATITTPAGVRTVMNFHGLWNGNGKTDTEDRLRQSDRIIQFLQSLNNPYILCGDFNLLPETESLKKFETLGLRNLIKEYGITSTRTSYYTKENKFADYVFVSNDIEVKEFKVLPDEVSDHAPLYLEVV